MHDNGGGVESTTSAEVINNDEVGLGFFFHSLIRSRPPSLGGNQTMWVIGVVDCGFDLWYGVRGGNWAGRLVRSGGSAEGGERHGRGGQGGPEPSPRSEGVAVKGLMGGRRGE